ncbi:MAG: hypothetical protein P4M05_21925 [Bradyrhizobium sp.]|nr:hypothetical protein [Bradyrhizobium sp.]
MNDLSAVGSKRVSALSKFRAGLTPLLCLHIVTCCVSLAFVASSYPDVVAFDNHHLFAALLIVIPFSVVAILFTIARFSFGYFLGFYFYTMILGYLWLIEFSKTSYDHPLAIVSIYLSALAFLTPALFITSPFSQRFALTARGFEALLSLILFLATATIAFGALYNFKLASLSDIYKFRAGLEFPAPLRYSIGVTTGALLPFAFACFVERGNRWRAAITLLLILPLYPITLTKLTLFTPCWLLFLLLVSRLAEARISVILSLLLPILLGVAWMLVSQSGSISSPLMQHYISIINVRMIATPSIALEVYNNFFSTHDLTHFCQINVVKPFVSCPYSQPLSVVMNSAYTFGNFNASLFATEGIASVGLALAPLSVLVCGLVIGLSNRLSSGLPPRFVLLSGGLLPHIFLNVPFSTTLLSNGAAVLFLLWYVTPRAMFGGGDGTPAPSPEGKAAHAV